MTIDLKPAVERTADVVRGVRDDQLEGRTPCPAYTVGDLLDHVGGLSFAFTAAATKDVAETGDQAPSADASRLGDDWRTRIPADLAALADAWRDPEAWTGMTKAGGVDLPGEVAGLVALNEVVIHGWDVARASGQPYDPDTARAGGVPRVRGSILGTGRRPRRDVRARGRRAGRRAAARPVDRAQRA